MEKKIFYVFIFSFLITVFFVNQVLAVKFEDIKGAIEASEVIDSSNSGNSNNYGGGGGEVLCLEPPPVSNLTYTRDNNLIRITFKTPNTLNLSHFVARISTNVFQGNFDIWGDLVSNLPIPIMNATQTIELTHLNPNQKYYFGIQLFNYCGKKSLITIITLEPASTPLICQPPLPINYLNILRNQNNAVVNFKTPNLVNLSHFVIRYSSSTFQGNFQNWGQLLNHNLIPYPNATQTITIGDLLPNQKYYVGIKLFNNCNLGSEVVIKEIPAFFSGVVNCPPVYPVEKIFAKAGLNEVTLNWQTPRGFSVNDNLVFEIRKSLQPITSNNFFNAEIVSNNLKPIPGEDQSLTIKDLNANTLYYFAVVLKNQCNQISSIVSISVRTLIQNNQGGGGGGSFGSFGGNRNVLPKNENVRNYYIFINNNDPVSYDLNVILNIYAENANEMMISNYSDFRDGYWLNYRNILNWRLLEGEGVKRVYAKFRSSNGSISEIVFDEILYQKSSESKIELPKEENREQLPSLVENNNIKKPFFNNINTDFNQLMVNWLNNSLTSLEKNDLNKDGIIDYEDIKFLFNNWQDIKINKTDYKITNFSLEPKYNLYFKKGEEIKIVLLVKPIKNELNYTSQIILNYSPEILEFKSFEYGKNWIPVLGILNYDYLDPKKGLIIKTAGYPKGFDETKIFGVITFKIKKEGQTLVNINNAFSLNNNNEDLFKGLENSILITALNNNNNNNFLLALLLNLADKNFILAYLLILTFLILIYILILLIRRYFPLFLASDLKEIKNKTS